MVSFQPLSDTERRNLTAALRRNANDGAALMMDRKNTGFLGTSNAAEETDETVIDAVRSVPTHYAK